jgi:UPF0716 protein FxsA
MLGKVLIIFIITPMIELFLLIEIGKAIGTLEVIGLTIATGIAGAALAKSQGLSILRKIQKEMAEGRIPAANLIDGLMILIGGILLLTPGVLTDAIGFLCLIPWTRVLMKRLLTRWMISKIQKDQVHIHIDQHPWSGWK